jgi:toxin CcdB
MAQFDVFANPDKGSQARIPYVVSLQSDLLDTLQHYVVAPLRATKDATVIPLLRLNPCVTVESDAFYVRMQDLATVPRATLKRPVANLAAQRDELLAALDFLFTGY